jgi:miniconductance mechanosensitive channel
MKEILPLVIAAVHPYRGLFIVAIAAILSLFLSRKIFLPIFKHFAKRTKGQWDDMLVEYKAVDRFAHIVPAAIIAMGLPYALPRTSELYNLLYRANNIYFILVAYWVFDSVLSSIAAVIQLDHRKRGLPIQGLFQALKLVGFIICAILVISQVTEKSPLFLLSGLGALTAVLMLVFKDTILGFVAGIQIMKLDLIRTGDWIEVPKHDADGEVIDVSLTSVRIRNWDNSITSIPAYELVSSSLKNWRGMSESGGRRIQRALSIDIHSVRYLRAEEIQELLKIKLLRPYLETKIREIEEYNQKELTPEEDTALANGHHLTNLNAFRAYCEVYVKSFAAINQNMTVLVRQLPTGPEGQPLEIYAFSKETDIIPYEALQSDIFDHLITVMPLFGLHLYQRPCGTPQK